MRRLAGAFAVILFEAVLTSSCFAESPERDLPPADYFVGKYQIIGRKPGSSATYSGTVELRPVPDDAFLIIRRIGDHAVEGFAAIDRASPPADHALVLRVRFKERSHEYEGIFLWRSDLDNYPRLTGFIYQQGTTKSPGLEAWFPTATLKR